MAGEAVRIVFVTVTGRPRSRQTETTDRDPKTHVDGDPCGKEIVC